MPELPASSPKHLIHGAESAHVMSSGLPTDFAFTYGTWNCGVSDLPALGVITSYNVAPVGDAENLKDGSGATFAHVIKDPGWEITASILVRKTATGGMAPKRMDIITFNEKIEGAGDGNAFPSRKAVVMSASVKWEREGWTMLEVKAESRDSLAGIDTWGTKVNEVGGVEAVIYTPA